MDRTNEDRALAAFSRVKGYGEDWEYTSPPSLLNDDDDAMLAQQLSDLLCDMRHLADLASLEWNELLERADNHYWAEYWEGLDDAG